MNIKDFINMNREIKLYKDQLFNELQFVCDRMAFIRLNMNTTSNRVWAALELESLDEKRKGLIEQLTGVQTVEKIIHKYQ